MKKYHPLIILGSIFIIFLAFNSSTEKLLLDESYLDCLDKEYKETGECLRQLAGFAYSQNNAKSIEVAIEKIDIRMLNRCHEFMHYLGWEAYINEGSLPEAFLVASGMCDSGMYHGIVEEYMNDSELNYTSEDLINIIIPNACETDFSNNQLEAVKHICYHGLGHGFMFITDNDLEEALNFCDYVKSDYGESCQSGAFMENVESKQVSRFGGHPKVFAYNDNDPDYPCSVLSQEYKNKCYAYKGAYGSKTGDYRGAFEACLDIDEDYQNVCFRGIGNNIPAPIFTPKEAGEKCRVALDFGPKAYSECVTGAMSFLIQLNLGSAMAAVEFCDAIEDDYKDNCYRRAGENLQLWLFEGEELESKCSFFSDEKAQKLCLHQ